MGKISLSSPLGWDDPSSCPDFWKNRVSNETSSRFLATAPLFESKALGKRSFDVAN